MTSIQQVDWAQLLLAFLNDPIDKALDVKGHESRAARYASTLAREDLAELEALVWGNTKVGSPVSISVEPGRDNSDAKQYAKQSICREHGLAPPPRNRRVIQGLFYASYGMDEKNSESRWYRDAGNCWRLILTVRAGDYELKGRKVSAELLKEQARAALWLLTEYGGVGSKARKGFGSFADARIESIRSIDDCKPAETGSRRGRRSGVPHQRPTETQSPSVDAGLPKNGTRISAILLEERTKKGGWKAEWNNGAMLGHILNSDEVPDSKKAGMEVDLFVRSARAETAMFEWPTPEVEARNARSSERHRTRQNRRRQ